MNPPMQQMINFIFVELKKYKRLSLEERIIIEILLKENRTENHIASK
jgi:hypothetical protein